VLRDVEAPAYSTQSAAGRPLPQEDAWYSFLLEAESTPRAIVRQEGLVQLKKLKGIGNRIPDLPICSIISQPTTLTRA
jgi:hypothetical protein